MNSSRSRSTCAASWASVHGRSFFFEPVSRRLQESEVFLKLVPSSSLWCFESTMIAAFRFSRAWMLSVSMPWNSPSCFLRSAVASASAFLSAASSVSSSLTLLASSALLASDPSMVAVSSAILAVEASMAAFFSYLPLLHQQPSCLLRSSSSSCSFLRVSPISFRRFTTRVIGVSLPLPESRALSQVCSSDAWRSEPGLATTPRTDVARRVLMRRPAIFLWLGVICVCWE
mmetsp:Transcript_68715/g.201709  ORF Transcript_68715/g.201709 Transcript_68715/m.201709 type:complete len:230 (-) Transcript_68715:46-735(-)